MFTALLLTLALAQKTPETLVLPLGVQAEYQKTCLEIKRATVTKDWEQAKKQLASLPKTKCVLKVEGYSGTLDPRPLAAEWGAQIPGLKIESSGTPDVVVSFEEVSEKRLTIQATTPRVQAVFPKPHSKTVALNDLKIALGSYFGLAMTPQFGEVMNPLVQSGDLPLKLAGTEISGIRSCLYIADQLRAAVLARRPVALDEASIELKESKVELPSMLQGEQKEIRLTVNNRGGGMLNVMLSPECSCFSVERNASLLPGAQKQMRAVFDSTEFGGPVTKHLNLLTNDGEHPVIEVPVTAPIQPAYRWFFPKGNVQQVEGDRGVLEGYLLINPKLKLAVKGVGFEGMEGVVQFAPYSGCALDESGFMTGYRLNLEVQDSYPPGRAGGSLVVRTDHSIFSELRQTVWFQKGAAFEPNDVYFGKLDHEGMTAKAFLIPPPNTLFKILKIESSAPFFSAKEIGKEDGKIAIEVQYLGGAPSGRIVAQIKIHTSLATQPVIVLPVRGRVP